MSPSHEFLNEGIRGWTNERGHDDEVLKYISRHSESGLYDYRPRGTAILNGHAHRENSPALEYDRNPGTE